MRIPYLTRKSKLRIASVIALVAILGVLAYYASVYRSAHSALDLITQRNTQWNCTNYDAQFYVSEERRIEGSIVIDGETVPFWIGYRPSYAELYACDADTVSQPDSNDFLIAKTRFRAYNGELHFIFIEDVAGLGVDKLVFEVVQPDKDVLSVGIRSLSLTDNGLSLVWCVQNCGNYNVFFDENSIAQVSLNSNQYSFSSDSVSLRPGEQHKIDISIPSSCMRTPGLNTVKITAKSKNGTNASVIESFEYSIGHLKHN